jgi:uncharacterized protein YbbC (DUF1343 family)
MPNFIHLKSTVFVLFFLLVSCPGTESPSEEESSTKEQPKEIVVAANRTSEYLPLLKGKRVALVANQTSVIFTETGHQHLVDSLLAHGIELKKIFSPEHGFRGRADAGEAVKDGKDTKTGLPLVSLYGKNKKPSQEQLDDVDLVLFDIQDVGVRFYTYIATLQYVMEACADKGLPLIVLDRPNPNGHYVDGPTMQKENSSFLGLNEIPLVYGMTIAEYAVMIHKEGWLDTQKNLELTVIPLENYTHQSSYQLPIRPSPNLPNDQSINLYPSLGLFEGTTINAGRGTEHQFQRYGSSVLDQEVFEFTYTPQPNFGSKYPKEQGKLCFGEDLSRQKPLASVDLQWVIRAYQNSTDKKHFFLTASFTKHAGQADLQKQIESGLSAPEIRASWSQELEKFKQIRKKYLMYP